MKKIHITEKIKQFIIKDYQNGISNKKIEEKYSISRVTLQRRLKEWNIPKKQKSISKEQLQLAVNDLKSGMLMKDVVKKHNISYTWIYKFMHKTNQMFYTDHGRKNKLNKTYFNKIDNEHKAYWLGFIFADGSLTKSNSYDKTPNRLQFNLSQKDKNTLEKILIDLESTANIMDYIPSEKTYASNPMSRLSINSIDLCKDLRRHGVVLKKNRTFPWNSMSKKLYRHFIRGYFDGDGSISQNFQLTGYRDMLADIQIILIENCNLNKIKLYEYPNKYVDVVDMCYGGKNQLTHIYNYLYHDSTIYLSRKKDKFSLTISS